MESGATGQSDTRWLASTAAAIGLLSSLGLHDQEFHDLREILREWIALMWQREATKEKHAIIRIASGKQERDRTRPGIAQWQGLVKKPPLRPMLAKCIARNHMLRVIY